jgi:glucose/arabinose dehydrogenase
MMTCRLQSNTDFMVYLRFNMRYLTITAVFWFSMFCSESFLMAQPQVELEVIASGFTYPVQVTNAGDDRMFVVQRQGKIRIIDEVGDVLATPFLDITSQIESGYEERGLLGLAFHPDYATNGYFYVSYTNNSGNSVISRFSVSGDPDLADEDSEEILFTADQPYSNHNGGCILFGPDGYLYISLGDGGSGGDPGNRAQNPENKLGKIHRIDVDGALPYEIPADNPFAGSTDTLETIWSLGLRNVWRFSFDRETGDMWLADVGQNVYEEVNFEPVGEGGRNYGWRCYEANAVFNPSGCEDEDTYVFPILDYNHSFATGGYSITGGYVYRGSDFPGMVGYYLTTDFVSGNWWWVRQNLDGSFTSLFLDDIEDDIAGFGEDVNGELYACDLYAGVIYRITDACGDFALDAVSEPWFCEESPGQIDLTITAGEAPYTINWTTGSTEEDVTGLAPGFYSVTVADDAGCERFLEVAIDTGENPEPSIDFDGTQLATDGGIAWQWYLNGNPIPSANGMTYVPEEDGIYSVEVTWDNGCSAISGDIDVTLTSLTTLPEGWVVYPVPFSDRLMLTTAADIQHLECRLLDMNGRTVLVREFNSLTGGSTIEFDVDALPAGSYQMVMTSEQGVWLSAVLKD